MTPQDDQLDLFVEGAAPSSAPRRTFVAFDLETSGLKPPGAGIIEVAGVKFTLDAGEEDIFQELANPGHAISPTITRITGITSEMVADARPSSDVLRDFFAWVGADATLVAHNAPFDSIFVVACCRKNKIRLPETGIFDTLPWARELWPALQDHKLGTLLRTIRAAHDPLHRGLADARGVMNLVRHMAHQATCSDEDVAGRAMDLVKMSKVKYWTRPSRNDQKNRG